MPIDHVHALPPGTRFEEYRLDAVLGAGGFGITYRAYDAHLDMFVAIKEYLPGEFAARTEASTVVPKSNTDAQDYHWGLTRFLDEARTLARFNHPHLNRVLRFFESNGTAYMVLEYIDGETLADRLSKESYLGEAALQRMLDEVLSGLAVMHEAGYVHRDIKPGNLMLREGDGSAMVLDFGAARQAVGQRSKAITSILTPGYAPVEQYDGKVDRVGPWTDIYALGMVAYRCISGIGDSELPDAVARMLAHTRGEAVLLPAVEAGKGKYNPKLLEAIDWAMEVNEHDRPQSVDAWREALAGGSRRKSPAKTVRKPTIKPTRGTTPERIGIHWSSVALTVVIVVLVGAGVWQGLRFYQGMPGDGLDEAVTTVGSQVDIQTEPQAGTESDTRTEQTPADTESDSVAETVLPTEDDEVTHLLAAAEADLKARRLTSPAGNNAWEKYQQVLSLSPSRPEAIAGIERVMGSYMELFGLAIEQEDFDKASDYLGRISELHPDSPLLEEGMRRIESAKQARAARLAEQQRQRLAEQERQRIAQAIEAHWSVLDAALETEDLDDAASIMSQVRDLNPEAPGLAEREERLVGLERQREQTIQAHWVAFETALDAEDLDEAENLLTELRSLNPEAPVLAAGVERLEAVRAALKRQRQAAEMKARELGVVMVSIPGGTFPKRFLSGGGRPTPAAAAFKMGKYEVTFTQWDACVADGGCGRYTPDDKGWGRGNRPVMNVSWGNAQAFILWLNDKTGGNYRLPSEAEWEYAARAGSTTKYSWGNSIGSNRANCNDNCGDRWSNTSPVGSFSANAWGLHDMHGNVWEWVQDCYSHLCTHRVIRGGSWFNTRWSLRSAYREGRARSGRGNGLGFRLAQDP